MLYSAKLVMLNAVYTDCCNRPLNAECNYAKRHYDECHYAQCRGAILSNIFMYATVEKCSSLILYLRVRHWPILARCSTWTGSYLIVINRGNLINLQDQTL